MALAVALAVGGYFAITFVGNSFIEAYNASTYALESGGRQSSCAMINTCSPCVAKELLFNGEHRPTPLSDFLDVVAAKCSPSPETMQDLSTFFAQSWQDIASTYSYAPTSPIEYGNFECSYPQRLRGFVAVVPKGSYRWEDHSIHYQHSFFAEVAWFDPACGTNDARYRALVAGWSVMGTMYIAGFTCFLVAAFLC